MLVKIKRYSRIAKRLIQRKRMLIPEVVGTRNIFVAVKSVVIGNRGPERQVGP